MHDECPTFVSTNFTRNIMKLPVETKAKYIMFFVPCTLAHLTVIHIVLNPWNGQISVIIFTGTHKGNILRTMVPLLGTLPCAK